MIKKTNIMFLYKLSYDNFLNKKYLSTSINSILNETNLIEIKKTKNSNLLTFLDTKMDKLRQLFMENLSKDGIKFIMFQNKRIMPGKTKATATLDSIEKAVTHLKSSRLNQLGVMMIDTPNYFVLDYDNKDNLPDKKFMDERIKEVSSPGNPLFLIEETPRGFHLWFKVKEEDISFLTSVVTITGNRVRRATLMDNTLLFDYLIAKQMCTLPFSEGRNILVFRQEYLSEEIQSLPSYWLPFPKFSESIDEKHQLSSYPWGEGVRNVQMFHFIVCSKHMLGKLDNQALVSQYYYQANEVLCIPPLGDGEITTIITSAHNYILTPNRNTSISVSESEDSSKGLIINKNNTDRLQMLNEKNPIFSSLTSSIINSIENGGFDIKSSLLRAAILYLIEDEFLKNNFCLIGDFFYIRYPKLNYWQPVESDELKYYLVNLYHYVFPDQLSNMAIQDMFSLIKMKTVKKDIAILNGNRYIVFKNLIWDLENETSIQSYEVPDDVIIVNYKDFDLIFGEEPIKFLSLFKQGMEGDVDEVLSFLKILLNLVLTNRYQSYNYYLELVGIAGSGKSTILKLLQVLVGRENIISTSFKNIEKNIFGLQGITESTKIIQLNECPPIITEFPSIFKQLTGNDFIIVNPKFREAKYVNFKGLVVLIGNEEIQFKNEFDSYSNNLAILRRRLCINLTKKPENIDPFLLQFNNHGQPSGKLIDELGILWGWILSMKKEDSDHLLENKHENFPNLFKETLNNGIHSIIENYTGYNLKDSDFEKMMVYLIDRFIKLYFVSTTSTEDIILVDCNFNLKKSFFGYFAEYVDTMNSKLSYEMVSYRKKQMKKILMIVLDQECYKEVKLINENKKALVLTNIKMINYPDFLETT